MRTKKWTLTVPLAALLLGGCSSSVGDGPPDVLACEVAYLDGEGAEEEATVEVAREIGEEGGSDSVTFAEGTEAELTFEVNYLSSHSGHGLVEIWTTPAGGDPRNVQTVEFEGEYPGGPETTGDEDLGNTDVSVDYVCDAGG